MTDPSNIIFGDVGIIMITRLKDSVQLSIYSTKALVHKYFVTMNDR